MPTRDKRKWKPNDYLRGREEFNVYPSMNPALQDMAMMEGKFITENHFIMLLTLEEARNITDELLGEVDDFFSYKLGPGNINDGLDSFRTLSKLTTYHNETGKLLVNFNTLKIKAVKYTHRGKVYIKITGYPGVRRILNGTRYGASNPQILEMAIGIRGLAHSIVKGAKFCICCSLAWRTIELIFKSDYDLVDFLVDVTMDVAKIIVSSVAVAGGLLALASAPLIVTTLAILIIGVIANYGLNVLDAEFGLSAGLKDAIRKVMNKNQHINEWNSQHTSAFFNLLSSTSD